ncbi:MAG: hypothetical protein JXB14_06375 [Candidatus Altiarchaeota archaeon]|nr:hypothetical protein [Candidatus Altiarchaeota archaeon]
MPSRLVVDANVVISSLINKGVPHSVFVLNATLERFEFVAPEFMFEEIKRHKAKALKLTRLSEGEFEEVYGFLLGCVIPVPAKRFHRFLPEARRLAPHPKDAPYLALALATNSPILSGDKGLKRQIKVEILTPSELLDEFLFSN